MTRGAMVRPTPDEELPTCQRCGQPISEGDEATHRQRNPVHAAWYRAEIACKEAGRYQSIREYGDQPRGPGATLSPEEDARLWAEWREKTRRADERAKRLTAEYEALRADPSSHPEHDAPARIYIPKETAE